MAQRRLRVGVSVKIAAAGDQQAVPPGKTIQLHGLRPVGRRVPRFQPGQPGFLQGKNKAVQGRSFQPQPAGVGQHRRRAAAFSRATPS